jgi:epsilon-lactone hydrolase
MTSHLRSAEPESDQTNRATGGFVSTEQREKLEAGLRQAALPVGSSVSEQRRLLKGLADAQPLPADVTVTSAALGGVPTAEITIGGIAPFNVVLYFHGGVYVLGDAFQAADLAAQVGRRTRAKVISVDYRLAPEHPYPAAVDDALAAYEALLADGAAPSSIAFAGESAGGGLAIATLVSARDRGLPLPAAALLMSPYVDLTLCGRTMESRSAVDPLLSRELLAARVPDYTAGRDAALPLISPLFADLSGLPHLIIQAGTDEVLLDDSLRIAARAAVADVAVTLDVTPRVPHVFQTFYRVLDEAAAALDRAGQLLSADLAGLRRSIRASVARAPRRGKVPGQLRESGVVKQHIGRREVLGQVDARAGSGDEQDVRRETEQPGERDLRRCRLQPCPQRREHGTGEQVGAGGTGQAQRTERDEGDVTPGALGQHVGRALVTQIEQVLHADDLGLVDGPQQLLSGDVAEPNAVCQAFLARLDQRGQLGVEARSRRLGRVDHAQVHRGQPAHTERDEVVLDPPAQMILLAVPRRRPGRTRAGGHLAHDRQAVRIRVQRLTDELVDGARAVELRGIDVVHPRLDRRPQHPQRLVTVARRPEHPVAGQLHRAVPGAMHPPRTECKRPAQVIPHQACSFGSKRRRPGRSHR